MEIKNIDINLILPYSRNQKKHEKKQIEQVANSIKRFGFVQPLVIDKDNNIVIGHCRYEASKLLGLNEIPCVVVDNLTDEEVKALRLADNKLNESAWDMALVIDELKGLETELIDLTGFSQDLIIEPEEKDDIVPEIPEEPKSKLGDIFQLGRHRIMCGDSLKDIDLLMEDKLSNMVFTDPPYLMGFEGNVHSDGSKSFNSKFGSIKNDKMSKEDGEKLGLTYIFKALEKLNNPYKALIIWNKGNHTLSNSDYMSKYEPIVYGWNKEHKFYGSNSNFDIWDIERTKKNELHPTMKPVVLCEKAIINSSEQNGVVLDLFLGSGSTLIACEKTNRICYGMELEPKYIDVIIKRFHDYNPEAEIKCLNREFNIEEIWEMK
jgi:DNA modification methylase